MKPTRIAVVDDFYRDPERVVRFARELAFESRGEVLGRCSERFQAGGIRRRIETAFAIEIKRWETVADRNEYQNGSLFLNSGVEERRQVPCIHHDTPRSWATLLVYLSENPVLDCGTSMWTHRATGLSAAPTHGDTVRLSQDRAELERRLMRDSHRPARWAETLRIGNVFNRAVLFSSSLFHSTSRYDAKFSASRRMVQAFRFSFR